jgi:predicted PurR-regulated permease PerM
VLPTTTGIGPRERRWLVIFLILGSAYFAVLLLQLFFVALAGFSQILLIVFLAWLLAFVMSPVVGFLQTHLPLSRGAVVAISYLLALVALGFILFYTGTAITQQVTQLTENFPSTAEQIKLTLADWQRALQIGRLQIDFVKLFQSASTQVEAIGGAIFSQAREIAGVTVTALGALALIIILSLYMLMDSQRILDRIARLVPNRYRDELEIFERAVARAFGGFLRGQLLLAVLQALLVGIVGAIFGVPYLFLVGTLSALAMLIPFFGPPLALIPPIVAAAIFVPSAFLPVTIILVVVQTVTVNWLQPRLMREALGMHPILVLLGLLVGAQVAGVWGALFGIPVIAVLNVFVSYVIFRAIPNAALPEEERLRHVDEGTMVEVEKAQLEDETHPRIRVRRSLRPDGSEEVQLEVEGEPPPL